MRRRDFLTSALGAGLGLAGAPGAAPKAAKKSSTGVYFEVHGSGIPLIMGYPIMASKIDGDPGSAARQGYLDRLTDRYRVLTMDYPNLGPGRGQSKPIPVSELTARRVCDDLLAVADAAGFDRFAWWGFSWGGVIGLQLASRTDRVAALVCGGWPPLGGQYADILRGVRARAAKAESRTGQPVEQYVTFYESLQGWHEADAVGRIKCPRMAFVGTKDEVDIGGVMITLGKTIHERRRDLERMGWQVAEIEGRDHSVFTDPGTVVPVVRKFLDKAI